MKFVSLKRGKQAGTRKSSVEENGPAAKKTDSSETDEEDSDLETEDDQEIDNDPDERKLRDYERRERFVFRYGEKLEADVEAKAMLKPVVRACRRAQCERLKTMRWSWT